MKKQLIKSKTFIHLRLKNVEERFFESKKALKIKKQRNLLNHFFDSNQREPF